MKKDNVPSMTYIKLLAAIVVLVIGGSVMGLIIGKMVIYGNGEAVKGSITLSKDITVRTVNIEVSNTDLSKTVIPNKGTAVIPAGTTGEYYLYILYHTVDKGVEPLTTFEVRFPLKDKDGDRIFTYVTRKSFEECQKDSVRYVGRKNNIYIIESVKDDEYQYIFDEYEKTVDYCLKEKWVMPRNGFLIGFFITLAVGVALILICRFTDSKTFANYTFILSLVIGALLILLGLALSTYLSHY